MKQRRVQFAFFLLLVVVVDLSTGGICMAGTFPVGDSPADLTLSAASSAYAQPVANLDDDGCFCCCTHMLSGSHSVSSPPQPVFPVPSLVRILSASAVPQSPFHPPKR